MDKTDKALNKEIPAAQAIDAEDEQLVFVLGVMPSRLRKRRVNGNVFLKAHLPTSSVSVYGRGVPSVFESTARKELEGMTLHLRPPAAPCKRRTDRMAFAAVYICHLHV